MYYFLTIIPSINTREEKVSILLPDRVHYLGNEWSFGDNKFYFKYKILEDGTLRDDLIDKQSDVIKQIFNTDGKPLKFISNNMNSEGKHKKKNDKEEIRKNKQSNVFYNNGSLILETGQCLQMERGKFLTSAECDDEAKSQNFKVVEKKSISKRINSIFKDSLLESGDKEQSSKNHETERGIQKLKKNRKKLKKESNKGKSELLEIKKYLDHKSWAKDEESQHSNKSEPSNEKKQDTPIKEDKKQIVEAIKSDAEPWNHSNLNGRNTYEGTKGANKSKKERDKEQIEKLSKIIQDLLARLHKKHEGVGEELSSVESEISYDDDFPSEDERKYTKRKRRPKKVKKKIRKKPKRREIESSIEVDVESGYSSIEEQIIPHKSIKRKPVSKKHLEVPKYSEPTHHEPSHHEPSHHEPSHHEPSHRIEEPIIKSTSPVNNSSAPPEKYDDYKRPTKKYESYSPESEYTLESPVLEKIGELDKLGDTIKNTLRQELNKHLKGVSAQIKRLNKLVKENTDTDYKSILDEYLKLIAHILKLKSEIAKESEVEIKNFINRLSKLSESAEEGKNIILDLLEKTKKDFHVRYSNLRDTAGWYKYPGNDYIDPFQHGFTQNNLYSGPDPYLNYPNNMRNENMMRGNSVIGPQMGFSTMPYHPNDYMGNIPLNNQMRGPPTNNMIPGNMSRMDNGISHQNMNPAMGNNMNSPGNIMQQDRPTNSCMIGKTC